DGVFYQAQRCSATAYAALGGLDSPMPENGRVAIAITRVSKRFGRHTAVNDVTFEIAEGEFFSILGPSGCGKTTTLRMIGGFETPDAGRILLQGTDVTAVSANRRPVNMVFQQYALFPHMSIYDNVAFGLKVKRVPRSEHRERITELLRIVALEGLENRKPRQLSGGQQQRVALARALVNRPAALLLDEPLGALDVKLRKQMQLELKRIQNELRTTFVYVTHDQEEALSMSDRIAVMNDGVIEQLGAPREVYDYPATTFVADFVGVLNAMRLEVSAGEGSDGVARVSERERILVPGAVAGGETLVAVRPERIQIHAGDAAVQNGSRLLGTVAQIVYLGTLTQFHVDTTLRERLVVHRLSDEPAALIRQGSQVTLTWDRDDAAGLMER